MKYNKPEVVVLGSAVDAIQSSIKTGYNVFDSLHMPASERTNTAKSVAAYEADE